MQAVIDLNSRQANRVIEQAVRAQAELEIEPRTRQDEVLRGTLVGRDEELLRVDLATQTSTLPLYALLGAYCDVRTVLSGQLYMFGSCVVDAIQDAATQRLILRRPDGIQLANRRRFERRALSEFSQVRLWPSASTTPYVGELCNLSGDGLAARFIRGELDELLLVGDDVRVSFEAPGAGEVFELPATVCNKTVTSDAQQLIIGLEYQMVPTDPVTRMAVDRLQALLCDQTSSSHSEQDGEL